ncbi:MAG: NupC/NupG family nucleoside CNT transporter [Alphaproteobacteria bacterium]
MWQGGLGLIGLTAIAWLLSEDRRRVSWRIPVIGLMAQFVVAVVLLKVPVFKVVFLWLNHGVEALESATRAGSGFVFGYLGGGATPFTVTNPGASFILAFQALPMVLIVSAISAVLYHWRVLPLIVRAVSGLLTRTMGIGGAVGICAAATTFLGMIEAPLLIRPYLARLSRGELFIVMTAGMSTIAGTVMALYAGFLSGVIPDPIGHLLTASLVSVPAAIMVARMMVPDEGRTETDSSGPTETPYTGTMDAISRGTQDGISLLISIVAMLVVLVALVHLVNSFLGLLPDVAGAPLTLQRMLAVGMVPLVWLMGIPADQVQVAGGLLGTKIVLNELIAYLDLAHLPSGALSERSRIIMTYGMCGFANFGSLGIMIAGIGTMAPERRDEVVRFGLRAILSGTLASCMTGAIVGLLL